MARAWPIVGVIDTADGTKVLTAAQTHERLVAMAAPNPKLAMDDPVLKHMGYDFLQINQGQTVGEALASIR